MNELKNYFEKYNLWYRTQQFGILVAHLVLLYWMYYTLSHSGILSMLEVFYHFIGMAILGAVLIRGTAYWARHHYLKEINKK